MRLPLRFSIRGMLVFTALVAAGCYWRIARPTIVAKQFANAIETNEFAAADDLCVDPNRKFVNRSIYEYYAGKHPVIRDLPTPVHYKRLPFTVDVVVLPRSWNDFWHGRRRLEMRMDAEVEPKQVITHHIGPPVRRPHDSFMRASYYPLTASAWGILPPPDAGPILLERKASK